MKHSAVSGGVRNFLPRCHGVFLNRSRQFTGFKVECLESCEGIGMRWMF